MRGEHKTDCEFEFLTRMRKVYGAKEERVIEKMVRRIQGASREVLMPQMAWGIHFGADGTKYLSVQGSNIHYCEPRGTLPYEKYEKFEVALMSRDWGEMEASDFFDRGEIAKELEPYECAGKSSIVYAYVPKVLVEKVYQWCKETWGLYDKQRQ